MYTSVAAQYPMHEYKKHENDRECKFLSNYKMFQEVVNSSDKMLLKKYYKKMESEKHE